MDRLQVQSYEVGLPEYKAGARTNDLLISVDGTSVKKISNREIEALLTGEENQVVNIKVSQNGRELEIPIGRKRLSLQRADQSREETMAINWWINRECEYIYGSRRGEIGIFKSGKELLRKEALKMRMIDPALANRKDLYEKAKLQIVNKGDRACSNR